ncbi:MAG: 3-deoxy-D-manno-octulosonic acid transferase [Deltaproteobacteria bacterium]|nr:3-deoxy-D-manno-octulosonic acid transferase [Deltaproteobacteria bacterium]
MIFLLYDILLHASVIILLPYFIFKMAAARKYREGVPERFGLIKKGKLKRLLGGPVVWFHAVSVGETKAIMPAVRLLKEKRPEVKVLFSTVTRTGNRTAASDGAGLIDALVYFPLDLSWAIRRVVRSAKPRALIVVEKEVWPNLYRILDAQNVPVIVANGTISERSFKRFMRFKFFFGYVFSRVSFFCGRTKEDSERAIKAGVKKARVRTIGNLKFDIKPPALDPRAMEALSASLDIKPQDRVIVAGSTHPGEEEIILGAYSSLHGSFKGLKLILAPRHPERFAEAEALIKKTGIDYSKRSSSKGGDIILLDTVGELMTVYSFATVAFVGGSIVPGIGGHNLLEPAYFGKPVLYGPHLTTYLNMALMLEDAGGGIRVDEKGLAGKLREMLTNDLLRKRTGEAAKRVVEENRGASKRTVEIIEGLLRRAK